MHLSEGSTVVFPSLISPPFRFLDTPDVRGSHILPLQLALVFHLTHVDVVRTLFRLFLGVVRWVI